MKIIRRIISDIQRGENIDLYLTIPAAFMVGLVNLSGVVKPEVVASLTLIVLGAVATSILGNRYRVESLASKLSPTVANTFVDEFPETFKQDFEAASEIWLIGATLDNIVNWFYSTIERKLQHGHTFRVLIIDPDSAAVELSDMRAYSKPNAERARNEKIGVLQDFCDLRETAPDRLSIRTVGHPLGHSLIAMNPNQLSGILYVSYYPFKTPGGSLPKFVMRAVDGRWYEHFKQEAENLWSAGQDWKCKSA